MFRRLVSHLIVLLAAALLVPAWAQDTRSAGAAAREPLDLRMGAFRPVENEARPSGSILVPLAKDYRVGPNDLIDIEVPELENLKRTVRVNAAGAISLPLVGAILAAGLTSQELEERIADKYREKYLQNPQVSVFIKEFTTERITVEGAVAKPGIYPLTGRITLLRALALAGGFGPIANSSEVMLFRQGDGGRKEVAVFDVDSIRAGKTDDPPVKGDDLIVVQRDNARRVLRDSLLRDIIDSINPFSFVPRP